MLPLTAVTASPTKQNPWAAMGMAAVLTAIVALFTALLFQWATSMFMVILYVIAFLLIGVAPVIGYAIAEGRLGKNWGPIIGGFIGFLLTFILWPILVGALDKSQSIWKLLLASIVGFIIGIAGLLLLGTVAGQNPAWFQWGWVILWGIWGAVCGFAMSAWARPVVAEVVVAER